MVDVWEMMPSPDNQQVRTKIPKRHIMVAAINPRTQLVSIHFPGFTHAVIGKDRQTYASFAQEIAQIIESQLTLKLQPFRLKPVTDILLEDKEQGVVDLRRTLRFKRGGKMELDSESDEDAASALAQGLANTGIKISAEAIRSAFRSSEAQSVVLLWQKQQIITRASMRGLFPEILFVWNEAEPTLSLIDDILARLSRARTYIGSDGIRDAREYISKAPVGEVLRPYWIEQRFAITRDQALQLLLEMSASGLCRVKFRIKLEDHRYSGLNPWVSSISEIPLALIDDEGHPIESRRPEHIEVAFQRIEKEEKDPDGLVTADENSLRGHE